jgi:hypothetical protein
MRACGVVGRSGVTAFGADEVATSLADPDATAASSNPAGLALVEVVGLVAAEPTQLTAHNCFIFHVLIE